MIIYLRTLDGLFFELDVGVYDTMKVVKEKIFTQEGLYSKNLRLVFAGKELENERAIRDYGIQKESTIHIVFRFPSG